MIIKTRFIKILVLMGLAAMLTSPFAAVDKVTPAAAAASKTVSAGSTWIIDKTTNLSSLTIAEGDQPQRPAVLRHRK